MKQINVGDKIVMARDCESLEIYLKQIEKEQPLAEEEEKRLSQRAKNGDEEARIRLIRANLKFVVTVANRYQNYGLPLSDLINEGNIGLIEAVDKFDNTMGNRFITYARYCIGSYIIKSLSEKSRVIRLPRKQYEELVKKKSLYRDFENFVELGGDDLESLPVPEDLPDPIEMVPVDQPIGENGEDTIASIIPDIESRNPDESPVEELESFKKALDCLSERERKVVVMYFGLEESKEKSLNEISAELGLSYDKVRVTLEIAIQRLRKTIPGDSPLFSYLK